MTEPLTMSAETEAEMRRLNGRSVGYLGRAIMEIDALRAKLAEAEKSRERPMTDRTVRVVCGWNHDGNPAFDGKPHLGQPCPSCGNPIQGSAMTARATLAGGERERIAREVVAERLATLGPDTELHATVNLQSFDTPVVVGKSGIIAILFPDAARQKEEG